MDDFFIPDTVCLMAYFYSPFRKEYKPETISPVTCPFCDSTLERNAIRDPQGKPIENDHYRWVINYYPRFEGHTMLIPKRHITTFEEETPVELQARHELLCYASSILRKTFPESGIEIFLQAGKGSQATIQHLHWHLVPARKEDAFPGFEKLDQFVTGEEAKEKVILFPTEIKIAREELAKLLTETIGKTEAVQRVA